MKQKSNNGSKAATKWLDPFLTVISTKTHDTKTPVGLYEACKESEAMLDKVGIKAFIASSGCRIMFGISLFQSGPPEDCGPKAEQRFHGYPFDFVVTGSESAVSSPAWRYQQLLRLLKEFNDAELRWLLLARWLSTENVCEPEEFLPSKMLENLMRRYLKQTAPFSEEDCRVWNLVKIWEPYFKALRADLRALPKAHRGPSEPLERLGYDRDAVCQSLKTRTLRRAITNWLHGRGKGDARTLENHCSSAEKYLKKIR